MYDTNTAEIDISSEKHKNFAGARAIKKKAPVICHKIKKHNFDVGEEERRKSIKHYIGIPLRIGDQVAGLLNVEFHNRALFGSTEEMKSFYQKEIQAFTYLYEYQIGKRYFFSHLNDNLVVTS